MNFEITESEAELINEALHGLSEVKGKAMELANGYHPPGQNPFTEHDFGIPQIKALITKLGDAE